MGSWLTERAEAATERDQSTPPHDQGAAPPTLSAAQASILQLQASSGNAAVSRLIADRAPGSQAFGHANAPLIQRCPGCGGTCNCEEEEEEEERRARTSGALLQRQESVGSQWSAGPGAAGSSVGWQWSAGPGASGSGPSPSDEAPSIPDELEKFVSDPVGQIEQLAEETPGGLGKPGMMLDEDEVGELQEVLGMDGGAAADDDAEPLGDDEDKCPPSATAIPPSTTNTTSFTATTPEDIQDQAMSLAQSSPGHIERPVTKNLCTKANKTATVESAVVAVSITLELPIWSSAAQGKAKPEDKKIIEKYFNLIQAHEARHEAITRKHFADFHKALVGKATKPTDQAEATTNRILCAEAKAQEALDKKEGCVRFTKDFKDVELLPLATCGLPALSYTPQGVVCK
jgi:hypothetical protein